MSKTVRSPPTCPAAERAARIVWGAHILRYLSGDHCSHPKSGALNLDAPVSAITRRGYHDEEGSDLEDDDYTDVDVETEKATIISGTETNMLQKFLDASAELLSPKKGWDYVTATSLKELPGSITMTIARNDAFIKDGVYDDRARCRDLLTHFSLYLQGADQEAAATGNLATFEKAIIEYNRVRIMECLSSYKLTPERTGVSPGPAIPSSAARQWQFLRTTALQDQLDQDIDVERVVFEAYSLVLCLDFRLFLSQAYGDKLAEKLWRSLRLLARLLSNCRLLSSIFEYLPQFQKLSFELISDQVAKTTLDKRHCVRITDALRRLIPAQDFKTLDRSKISTLERRFGAIFQTASTRASYSQHAEIQTLMHHWSASTAPTLNYLGCSKKMCLLCEEFLSNLDPPISTRGRHGICYSAWGVPHGNTSSVLSALQAVEISLVSRILDQFTQRTRKVVLDNVPQSTVLSGVASMAEEFERAKFLRERVRDEGKLLRQQRQIVAGETSVVQSDDLITGLTSETSCVMCNQLVAKRCSRCRSSYYCSKLCQKSDWPLHWLLCKKFHQMPSRPSTAHKRAIFFPTEATKPEVFWVLCEMKRDDGEGWYEHAQITHLLGPDHPTAGTAYIGQNRRRKRIMGTGFYGVLKEGYWLALRHRETFLIDGSLPNKSIARAAMASGMSTGYTWMGPVVALRKTTDETTVQDITIGDFRHVIDYLLDYAREQTRELDEVRPSVPKRASGTIYGVMIHCYGAIKLYGKPQFSQIEVPANHPIHRRGELSSLSKLVSLPIRLWKSGDLSVNPPGWADNMTADSNQNAAFLMMGSNPNEDGWGWAPMRWSIDLGDVLAVRDNGQDLLVDDALLLCYFCRRKLQPLFEDSMGGGWVSRSKQEVLEFITKENMEKFREEARADLGS